MFGSNDEMIHIDEANDFLREVSFKLLQHISQLYNRVHELEAQSGLPRTSSWSPELPQIFINSNQPAQKNSAPVPGSPTIQYDRRASRARGCRAQPPPGMGTPHPLASPVFRTPPSRPFLTFHYASEIKSTAEHDEPRIVVAVFPEDLHAPLILGWQDGFLCIGMQQQNPICALRIRGESNADCKDEGIEVQWSKEPLQLVRSGNMITQDALPCRVVHGDELRFVPECSFSVHDMRPVHANFRSGHMGHTSQQHTLSPVVDDLDMSDLPREQLSLDEGSGVCREDSTDAQSPKVNFQQQQRQQQHYFLSNGPAVLGHYTIWEKACNPGISYGIVDHGSVRRELIYKLGMEKSRTLLKTRWSKRLVVLYSETFLVYYKDTHPSQSDLSMGCIYLPDAHVTTCPGVYRGRSLCIQIHQVVPRDPRYLGRPCDATATFVLSFSSCASRDAWINLLRTLARASGKGNTSD